VTTVKNIYTKNDSYKVRLENFEGPLDLLLHLIRQQEVDIYDIPIAEITRQYLEYVDLMRELDLEVAGEFILMAATLIQIKVRMLLPRETSDEEGEEEDPRAELVRQLLDYQRFKEVSEDLGEKEDNRRRLFTRSYFEWEKQYEEKEIVLKDLTLFDLLTAFKSALDNAPKIDSHTVTTVVVTIEDQIKYIEEKLEAKDRIPFGELMAEFKERIVIIVTFMAILHLIRDNKIRVQQASIFSEIYILKRGA